METKQLPITDSNNKLTVKSAKKFESSRLIKVSLDNSTSKIEFKSEGHKKGRMKITLKFAKDEAEGFNNFCKLAKPDHLSSDDFAKFLFYKGVEALQQDFAKRIEQFRQEDPEGYAKMRAEVEAQQGQSEGSVTVAEEAPKLWWNWLK